MAERGGGEGLNPQNALHNLWTAPNGYGTIVHMICQKWIHARTLKKLLKYVVKVIKLRLDCTQVTFALLARFKYCDVFSKYV